MKYWLHFITLCLFAIVISGSSAYGQEGPPQPGDDFELDKLAQTSMKFLSTSVDARVAAMGGAVTAVEQSSAVAMFHNPSTMAGFDGTVSATLGRANWLVDINHSAMGVAYQPSHGQYGVFGLTFRSVDYGQFNKTILADNDAGFEDLGSYNPSAMAIGLGYARHLTTKVAVGGNIKFARQRIGESVISLDGENGPETKNYAIGTGVFDFGLTYMTGFRSLNFAMSVRNFSRELAYDRANFELPLTFRVGLAMDLMDLTPGGSDMHALNFAVDARRSRDYDEQIRVGGEYVFLNTLTLRAGYALPSDEERFSGGIGLKQEFDSLKMAFDYAYTDFGIFNNVHRISLNFGL